jgi:hypothetical protein
MQKLTTDSTGLVYQYIPADDFEDYEFSFDPANTTNKDEPGYMDIRKGIGNTLFAFGELEHTLEQTIAIMLDTDSHDTGFLVTRLMSYSTKASLFSEIAHNRMAPDPQLKAALKLIREQLQICGRIRNIVAHAKWESITEDGYVRFDMKTDKESGELMIRYYHFDDDTFRMVCKRMSDAEMHISRFADVAHLL